MSLINEALKKAQWQRTHEAGADAAPGAEAARIVKRGKPQSAKTIILLGSAGVVLIVITAVATVFLFNRPASKPAPSAVSAPAHETTPAGPEEKSPIIVAPAVGAVTPPSASAPTATEPAATATKTATATAPDVANATAVPESKTAPAAANPAPATATAATSRPPSTSASAPTPAPAAPAPVTAPSDERVQAWIDAVKIGGVRAAGADSRVFMKDRLYRINDIVDRPLGIRLIKVEADSLTFSDANGVTYVKYF